MRFGATTLSVLRKPVIAACAMMLGVLGLTGCETKGFINPSEMGRYQRMPLLRPILPNLSSGYDEPNEEFPTATDMVAADIKADSTDYVIGRNDLLQISLTDVTPGVETVKTARVTESGNISLPLVGQINAAGRTESQLQEDIAKKYQDAGIVKNAQVSVVVIEARQRTFSVRGAVARPGQYAIIQSDFRILDVLVLAGDPSYPKEQLEYLYVIRPKLAGPATQPADLPPLKPGPNNPLDPKNDKTNPASILDGPPAALGTGAGPLDGGAQKPPVFITGGQSVTGMSTRPATDAVEAGKSFEFNSPLPEDQSRVIRVPLRQLLSGDLRFNMVVRPQDIVVIPQPEQGEYYMGGHVARVGVYSLTGRQITLKQAIISAGMLDEVAIPRRTDIIRRIGRDKEVWVRVDLGKVFDGTQPDLFLKPYDIVQVGTNAAAPFIAAARNAFRITYGFGFLYDRNFYRGNGGGNGL